MRKNFSLFFTFTFFGFTFLGAAQHGILDKENSIIPERFHLCSTPRGKFISRKNDQHIGFVLQQGRHWDEDMVGHFLKLIEPNSVVVDVGANIGTHTIPWARQAGKVYAFEPQRIVFQQLCANLVLNDIDNVYCEHVALGHKQAIACLDATVPSVPGFSPDRKLTYDTTAHPINYGGVRLGSDGESVEMRVLDGYNLTNVSLIKVDVEGAEPLVFYGARETIKRNKPILIYEKRANLKVTPEMIKLLGVDKEVAEFDIEAFVAKELPGVYEPPADFGTDNDRVLLPKRLVEERKE